MKPNFKLYRWLTILVYAGVGCGAIFLGRSFLPDSVRSKLQQESNIWVFLGLGLFLLVGLSRISGFRFGQIKTLFTYPTFLLAPILSWLATGYIIYKTKLPDSELMIFLIGFGILIYLSTLIFAACIHLFSSIASKPSKNTDSILPTKRKRNELKDYSALEIIQWAESENPIESPEEDLLNFRHRAGRVLDFLTKKDRNSVAILGHYGSGKTSLSKLITSIPRRKKAQKLIFVSVSCWGFNDADAAQKTVLNSIINRLSADTDCFAIAGMPSRFVESLSKSSDYADSVLHYISPRDPDAQLSQLSPILQAQDARLVVVIEDTERGGVQFDLASIEGLLNRFRDNEDISFVINASPDTKIDFNRLCEHVEYIPDIKSQISLKIFDEVREYSQKKFPKDIDLVSRKKFSEITSLPGSAKYGIWEFDLAKLVNTPRKLKATIRRFVNAWDSIHGEVDIDELLIASSLRVCAPPVFGFLMRHHSDFPLLIQKDFNQQEKENSPLASELKGEWATFDGQGFDLVAAGNLLQVISPGNIKVLFTEHRSSRTNLVQKISSRNIYAERIFNESITDDDIRDQVVLHGVIDSKGNWEPLANRIVESAEFRMIFDHFRSYLVGTVLKNQDLREIIKEVFKAIRKKNGSKASQESDGFDDAVRWFNTCQEDATQMHEMAFELVLSCLPENLELAADIYRELVFNGSDQVLKAKYGERLNQSLKDIFTKVDINALASGLNEDYPGALHMLVGSLDDIPKWAWLEPILWQGLTVHPKIFVPEVSMILGMPFEVSDLPEDFLLRENVLKEIFPTKKNEVIKLLGGDFEFNPALSRPDRGLNFSLVKVRAQKWLKKHKSEKWNI